MLERSRCKHTWLGRPLSQADHSCGLGSPGSRRPEANTLYCAAGKMGRLHSADMGTLLALGELSSDFEERQSGNRTADRRNLNNRQELQQQQRKWQDILLQPFHMLSGRWHSNQNTAAVSGKWSALLIR